MWIESPSPAHSIDKQNSLAVVLDELGRGDAHRLRGLLARAGVDVAAVRRLPHGGQFGRTNELASPHEVLTDALEHTAQVANGSVLLALCVLHECEQVWEVTYRYGPIQATLRALAECGRIRMAVADNGSVMTAVLAAATLLDREITVEHALTTATLSGVASAAREALELAEQLSELARSARTADPAIADYLVERAEAALAYHQPLAVAAVESHRFLTEPDGSLDDPIEFLDRSERAYGVDNEARRSEIRAHRLSLAALADRRDDEWLTVDNGKIIYLYPFGIRGIDTSALLRRATDECAGWELAGVRPVGVREWLGVDDMWEGSGFHSRRFDGIAMELPPVDLHDDAGRPITRLRAEMRLSNLG